MQTDQFTTIIENQINLSRQTLIQKSGEYASEIDRLHNFKIASVTLGNTPSQALAGFMAKHTVSIYDMIRSGEPYTASMWEEKITDHINYLLLLRAVIQEEHGDKVTSPDPTPDIAQLKSNLASRRAVIQQETENAGPTQVS